MARTIDLHNRLLPCIWFFPEFWRPRGVRPAEPHTILNLAFGSLRIPDPQDAADFEREPANRNLPEAIRSTYGPVRVLADLVLGRRPGLVLMEIGSFLDPDEGQPPPATIEEAVDRMGRRNGNVVPEVRGMVEMFGGQVLKGTSSVFGGSHLHFAGFLGPAFRLTSSPVNAFSPALEDLRLTTEALTTGVDVRCNRARIERTTLVGFATAVRFTAAMRGSLRWCELIGPGPLVAIDKESNDCAAVGCDLRSSGVAALLEGVHSSLVRCRIERLGAGGAGSMGPGQPLVQVAADGCALVGNRIFSATGTGPLILIGDGPRDTLLEKNTFVSDDGKPSIAPMLADHGLGTLLRDVSRSGFPPVMVSTRNYLANSTFEHWEGPVNRQLPVAWQPKPEIDNWNREGFRLDRRPSLYIRKAWAPHALFGEWQVNPHWRQDWPGEIPADVLFENTPEAHLGTHALWMGVSPQNDIRAEFFQVVQLPTVAPEFVLSAFIKARGPGQAFVEVGEAVAQSRPYTGRGGWQQATIRIFIEPEAKGFISLPVRCVLTGHRDGFTEAYFDHLMLVAGNVVPHHAHLNVLDVGGELPPMRAMRGRSFQQTFAPLPGQQMVAYLMGTAVESVEDILVSFRAGDSLARSGLVAFDLLRNDKSLFRQPVQSLTSLRVRGEYMTGRVSQALLVAGEIEQGDVLTLRAPRSVDELRVVLRGRVREI